MKKREEIEEEEKAKRNRVVVTFDLVGRKVLNIFKRASDFCFFVFVYQSSWFNFLFIKLLVVLYNLLK